MFIIAESNQLYLGDMLFYLVSFLIMAALVWHFAWKPVTQMMQKRADKIANDIDSAAQSREEAQKLAAKRQEELKGSRQEAARIVDNAKQAGESQLHRGHSGLCLCNINDGLYFSEGNRGITTYL